MKYLFLLLSIYIAYTMAVCSEDYGTMNKYGRLDVEDGITEIGEGAFNGCDKIRSLFLPDSVEIIQEYAFANTHLQRVLGGEGLRSLQNWSFANCSHLRLFDPSNVTDYQWHAFNYTYIRAISIAPYHFIHMQFASDGEIIF
tara:strand:+ start:867 stop:1292 length:426 start_codon:yes stop_codon:yes gene_type:complete